MSCFSQRNMVKSLLVAGSIIVVVGLMPSIVLAFGAIAIAERKGGEQPVIGIVTKYRSGREAAQAAFAQCVANGGKNCRVVLEFERCGSISVSGASMGTGEGITGRNARNMSLRSCGGDDCRVVANECEDQ